MDKVVKRYKTLILGGGASACMCAMCASNSSIAIIDANTKPAKKILVTGNGRCNLTNKNMSSKFFNVNIDKYLNKFNLDKTLEFFNNIGIEYYSDEEGRVYPLSSSAKSVQDVIIRELENKIDFYKEEIIQDVLCDNKKYIVKTDKNVFESENLVVSTGGNSINILNNLKIKYNNFIPSLVALKTKRTKELSGIKLSNVKVIATNKNDEVKIDNGEVLFKDSGLSGIVIFNISTHFSRIGDFKGNICIDLLPNFTNEQLYDVIERRKDLNVKVDKLFVGMFQNAVANEIFKQSKINTNKESKLLTKNEIVQIVKTIKNLYFEVVGCYDNNQVFSGGVILDELNGNLEHKKYKNLYFTGEVVNVDGECGGYNLQWAWTSGKIVGECL